MKKGRGESKEMKIYKREKRKELKALVKSQTPIAAESLDCCAKGIEECKKWWVQGQEKLRLSLEIESDRSSKHQR